MPVVVVNLVTIAADLQAGAARRRAAGRRRFPLASGAAAAALAELLLAGRYGQVVAVLRYLMLGFAAFGVGAVRAHPDWPRLLTASLVPALALRPTW
jgi:hypothetical protein